MEQEQSTQEQKPTPKNASWGAIISIIVILAMIVIGAFYAWGQRIDQDRSVTQAVSSSTQNQ